MAGHHQYHHNNVIADHCRLSSSLATTPPIAALDGSHDEKGLVGQPQSIVCSAQQQQELLLFELSSTFFNTSILEEEASKRYTVVTQ